MLLLPCACGGSGQVSIPRTGCRVTLPTFGPLPLKQKLFNRADFLQQGEMYSPLPGFFAFVLQHLPVLNGSSPASPHPHLSHCQTLLPKAKIASDFSFVRRPRPSKTLAFEACAVPLAGNGAALLCLLQEFIPRSAPGGLGPCQGRSAAGRTTDKPCLSRVTSAGLCKG